MVSASVSVSVAGVVGVAAVAGVVVVVVVVAATDHSRLLSCANRARGTHARGSQWLPFCEA